MLKKGPSRALPKENWIGERHYDIKKAELFVDEQLRFLNGLTDLSLRSRGFHPLQRISPTAGGFHLPKADFITYMRLPWLA